jgi:hypothetical protein
MEAMLRERTGCMNWSGRLPGYTWSTASVVDPRQATVFEEVVPLWTGDAARVRVHALLPQFAGQERGPLALNSRAVDIRESGPGRGTSAVLVGQELLSEPSESRPQGRGLVCLGHQVCNPSTGLINN